MTTWRLERVSIDTRSLAVVGRVRIPEVRISIRTGSLVTMRKRAFQGAQTHQVLKYPFLEKILLPSSY